MNLETETRPRRDETETHKIRSRDLHHCNTSPYPLPHHPLLSVKIPFSLNGQIYRAGAFRFSYHSFPRRNGNMVNRKLGYMACHLVATLTTQFPTPVCLEQTSPDIPCLVLSSSFGPNTRCPGIPHAARSPKYDGS